MTSKPSHLPTRWKVTEEVRTPGEIEVSTLATFMTKRSARKWMYDTAQKQIKTNPLLSNHPIHQSARAHEDARGRVEAEDDEIRIKIYNLDSYHQRFLRVEKV